MLPSKNEPEHQAQYNADQNARGYRKVKGEVVSLDEDVAREPAKHPTPGHAAAEYQKRTHQDQQSADCK
jgi:hypothetical protein